MPSRMSFSIDKIDGVFPSALKILRRLERAVTADNAQTSDFDSARVALEWLPYDQGTFAVACQNLDNALTYYGDGEIGAASYEVRMVWRAIAWEVQNGS